jgi:hypothetical protein
LAKRDKLAAENDEDSDNFQTPMSLKKASGKRSQLELDSDGDSDNIQTHLKELKKASAKTSQLSLDSDMAEVESEDVGAQTHGKLR